MRLLRNGEEVKSPGGGDGYTSPVNKPEGISMIMKIIAHFCGLSVEPVDSDERRGYKYRFEVSKNNEGS